ncbi:hypothetical protein BC835DRAFT_1310495 [Cytidiella melzeri]|nr:hypothetical protein BC835DRAFT_1310495 [Cytidiella melzeri]
MSLCATKRNSVLTGKNLRPLLNKTRVFARHYQKRTTTYLLVALANIAMDPFPETQGVEEEVEQNKIDGDGEEGNKESEEVEESGARRDEDGDKGVAIGSQYVRTLNCAPKVIQFAFEPDGLTARKAEPEPPSDGGKQPDTILHRLSPRMTIGLEHVVLAQGALHNAEDTTANRDTMQDSKWVYDAGILDKNLDASPPRSA